MQLRSALTVLAVILTLAAAAQDNLRGTMTMAVRDVAAIKAKAEAGDSAAQVALGEALLSSFHASEACSWFLKAAASGNVEGMSRAGNTLLFGAPGIPQSLSVPANPTEGLRWTFMAATKGDSRARFNMGQALRRGLGTSTNLVAAYAWLSVSGPSLGRVYMNEVALQLDGSALREAQALSEQFKAGRWVAPTIRAVPEGDARLRLNGITLGGKTPLAVINGKTVSEGESVSVPVKPGKLIIKCLKIEKQGVQVLVEGETAPRVLRFQ